MKFTLAFLAIFAGAVVANDHASCTCHNGDSFIQRISEPACAFYATDRPADVAYDTRTGRCESASGNLIDGDSWQAACRHIATAGYPCADGKGTCYAKSDNVIGWC